MKPYTLTYFSATATDIPSLSQGTQRFLASGGSVNLYARTQSQLLSEAGKEAFLRRAFTSDVVIITFHGGTASFPAFQAFTEMLSQKRREGVKIPFCHLQPLGGMDEEVMEAARRYSTDFGSPLWDTVYRYLTYGGPANIQALLALLHNHLFGTSIPCDPPMRPPEEGIYHPDLEGIPSLDDYLAFIRETGRGSSGLLIGLWFYQTYWLNGNLAFIDAIIRSLESHGAAALPVFHLRYRDEARGNMGADGVAKKFFMKGDRPRIHALINPLLFSLTLAAPHYRDILPSLGVPCIQAITSLTSRAFWEENLQGLSLLDISYAIAQPEFDGALITVPISTREEETIDPLTGAVIATFKPITERVDKMVRLTLNWARLRETPPEERRVAIVFHHYPPRNDRIGCAAGLDSFQSVVELLDQMHARGYRIAQTYLDGTDLAQAFLSRMTCDQRWLPIEEMAARAEAQAETEEVLRWHAELPSEVQEKMCADWGTPPGDLFVHRGRMLFPGILNGNVFLTIQPPRGYLENIEKIYHDVHLSPPHHYLSQYRWIRDVFKAHVVMHVGKHGSLEWLPGKAVGLSRSCYPDLAIMELPNVYPYIINDPGEGTQAKRRSYACIIDHLTPAMTNADLYDDLGKVQELMADYAIASTEDPAKMEILRSMLWSTVKEAHLDRDLAVTEQDVFADFDGFLAKLHDYLHEIGDTMINDGLHVFGVPPEGDRLVEFLVQLTRLPNGNVPSLREAIVASMGFDYDDVLEHRGSVQARFGNRRGSEVLQEAHRKALTLVRRLADEDYRATHIPFIVLTVMGKSSPSIEDALAYIADTLVPHIRRCREEVDAALGACGGAFVPPGPSGAPTRGQADILPTGRNFYSVDPQKIPTPAAWEVGVRLADALLERYLKETGRYPENVGILVYATSTMRTRGDDIAEIFALLGVRPRWQAGSGNVIGVEPIPLSELKRPRIDVTPRVSGLFRDAFPLLIERIDEAVQMVAALKESHETNFIRSHVESDVATYLAQGMSEAEALREATIRVFGCPPGTYGAGVAELVESKQWQTQEDLGNSYIRWSSHAYARGIYGDRRPETFRRMLSRMDVTVKNEDSREYDMMSCTDYYNYYGGLIVAAKTVRGSLPFATMGDSADPRRVKIRTTFEEAKHVLRSRLINPKWLEGMKRHGFKGAGDISHMMDVVFGWDATAEVIEDWMYEKIAHAYALDSAMREWMKEVNPHALHNILDKLLEAIVRGMWHAEKGVEEQLREALLEMEGELEEWSDRKDHDEERIAHQGR